MTEVSRLQSNDLAAFLSLPNLNRRPPFLATAKEQVDRHNQLNVFDSDVHPPVADLVFGNSFNKRRQHSAPSLHSPEQRRVWARAHSLINPLTETILASRPANDDPANDNDEMGDAA